MKIIFFIKNQRGLLNTFVGIVVLIILLILLGNLLSFFKILTPKSSYTNTQPAILINNWKIYKDDHVEFKYPSDWKKIETFPREYISKQDWSSKSIDSWNGGGMFYGSPDDPDYIRFYRHPFIIQNPKKPYSIIIVGINGSVDEPTSSEGGDYYRNITINSLQEKISVNKWRPGSLDNYGNKYPWKGDLIEGYKFESDYKDTHPYDFVFVHREGDDPSAETVFDSILKSLKFLKTYKLTMPTEWYTFQNDMPYFSFEYPSTWGYPKEEVYVAGIHGSQEWSGKVYAVTFTLSEELSISGGEGRIKGYSKDYGHSGHGDLSWNEYQGEANKPAFVKSAIHTNFNDCNQYPESSSYPDKNGIYGNYAYIKFNLPREDFGGLIFSVPILSKKLDFLPGENDCTLQNEEDVKVKAEKIKKILETNKNLDEETRISLTIYQHILETIKI